MKNLKKLSARIGVALMAAMSTLSVAFATTPTTNGTAGVKSALETAALPVADLIYALLNPTLIIVGAVGALYCILLGVKYAKAGEPQEREKAKGQLKNAIIGFVLIFVLLILLKALMPALIEWTNKTAGDINGGFGNGLTITPSKLGGGN